MDLNSKMTALADEIRELSGTTTSKSIDAMTSDIDAANAEISEQMGLIAQITAALENKAAGGSGVELPELDNPASSSDILSGKEAIDENGEIITGTIATKTSSNLTSSGATVTVPAGYYASNATKSISTGSAKTPATTVTKNPTISVSASGLISASVSGTQSVTPTVTAGYVSHGTTGTITVSGSATKQLTTQAAKTVTPTTSSQTAVASGRYTTGAVTVGPIPSNYEDVGTETTEYTSLASQLEAAINSLPEAGTGGGSGEGGIEYEIVEIGIAENGSDRIASIPFTLKRVTKTLGSFAGSEGTSYGVSSLTKVSHIGLVAYSYSSGNPMLSCTPLSVLSFSEGSLRAGSEMTGFCTPYVAIFINDPSQPAIYEEGN